MANIKFCESLTRKIENSPRFGEYYKKGIYTSFNENREDLIRCRQCYNDMIEVNNELINVNIDNKIYSKVIPEMEMISKEQNRATQRKYEDDIRILTLNIGNKIEQINQQNELKRLEFDADYINYICYLIEHHDTPISDEQIENNYDLCLKL